MNQGGSSQKIEFSKRALKHDFLTFATVTKSTKLQLWGSQARTTSMMISMLIRTCSLVSKISGEKIVMQWRYKSWPDGL